MSEPARIQSRDNPLIVAIRKLVQHGSAYRRTGQVWLEGEHLVNACAEKGQPIAQLLIAASAWEAGRYRALCRASRRFAIVDDKLLAQLGTLESAAALGALIDLPAVAELDPALPTVVLDRLQDPGNAGSILRSAAAFGWPQVAALEQTVALWSPKVLRAGMGAHFGLRLVEGVSAERLLALGLPLVATSSHAAASLESADWPRPCAWVFGHEGQGVDAALLSRCAQTVRIPQPGGEESLNVAAAAAVCLYEDLRRSAQ